MAEGATEARPATGEGLPGKGPLGEGPLGEGPLSAEELRLIDAYWRAANY
jgi:hypothetical protein